MPADMASEAMEVITMAVDKHSATSNYEVIILFFFVLLVRYVTRRC